MRVRFEQVDSMKKRSRMTFIFRVTLHCLSLYTAAAAIGFVFGRYRDADGLAGVSIVFLITCAFVWLSGRWLDARDAKKINDAPEAIRDNE